MKNPYYENLAKEQRRNQRQRPMRLNAAGLYVPHGYLGVDPEGLSWSDDVGFVEGGRRVLVFWQHPRAVYREAIEKAARHEVGPLPFLSLRAWLAQGSRNYRPAGRSRKRHVSTTLAPLSDERRRYLERKRQVFARLSAEGIDHGVCASLSVDWSSLARIVDIIAPLEVRNEAELGELATLARRLLRRETTLVQAFPDYAYTRSDWLAEAPRRDATRHDEA